MITRIAVTSLVAHPKNPRIEPRHDVVDQIASQIQAKGAFDDSHALIVRSVDDQYQIVSGHHRWLAAQQANISEVPCWVKEMTDEQAYMELVLCNTQSELHPLEEGKHAAESGMDLKAYAEASSKVRKTLSDKVLAFRVLSVAHVRHEDIDEIFDQERELAVQTFGYMPDWLKCDNVSLAQSMIDWRNNPDLDSHALPSGIELPENDLKNYVLFKKKYLDAWRNFAEIHATDEWLWSSLVNAMLEGGWTVQTTKEKVGAFKDIQTPPAWADSEQIAKHLVANHMRAPEIVKMFDVVEKAKVRDDDDDKLHHWMMEALSSELPSRLSEVQQIVSEWEQKQAEKDRVAREAKIAKQREVEQAMQRIVNLRKNVSLDEWKTLTDEERSQLLSPVQGNGGTFNKQESNDIEWAQSSWNPVTGCKHDCSYCYARDIAHQKRMEKVYPNKFEPSFRSDSLNCPVNTKVPDIAKTDARYRNVFTCSMADLFGRWVPKEWIDAVMTSVRNNPQWEFLFLTKFPQRLSEIEIPENAWMGTTVDLQARVANAEKAFEKVNSKIKWLSVEPMIEELHFERLELFNWVVIGGASKSDRTPEWRPPYRWIDRLVRQCEDLKIPVYMKSNLGIANRILELPFDAPVTQEPQRAPEEFFYLGKQN